MALKEQYDSDAFETEVPEAHRDLFTERDGKYVFNGVEGVIGSVAAAALRNEAGGYRIKLREATTALGNWSKLGEDPSKVQELLDTVPELTARAAAAGADEDKIRAIADSRVAQAEGKLNRIIQELSTEKEGQAALIGAYEDNERKAAVERAAVKAASDKKRGVINPDAMEDVLLFASLHLETVEERDEAGRLVITDVRTKDKVGVTPGLPPDAWLAEMQPKKGHWYLPSEGSGANGSGNHRGTGGANPWSAEGWNMTTQGQYVKEHGMERAQAMAKVAGTTVGGPRPMGKSGQTAPVQRRR